MLMADLIVRDPIIVNFLLDDLPKDYNGDCSRFSNDPDLYFWTCDEVEQCVRGLQPCMEDSNQPQCQKGYIWKVGNLAFSSNF